MAQPRKVRQAAAEAEKLHNEVYGKKGEQEEQKPDLKPVETTVEPMTPPKGEAEGVVQPPPQPPEQKQAEPESEIPKEETVEYWKARAMTKEGIDRKVSDENRELRQELAELRGAFATLKDMGSQRQEKPAEETHPQAQARHLLKPEEIADYGEDLIDVMKRAAREAVQGEIDLLKRENKSLKDSLGSFQKLNADKARNDVYGTLHSQVPAWQEINTSEEFLQWLNEPDLFTGKPRGQLLQEAFEANDAARVVAFFKAFLKEHQTVTPDQTAPQAQPTQQPARTLDTMVAPGKPRGGAASAQGDQKRTWSQKDIQAFYNEVHHGKWRGKEKEQRAIEQDIIAATKEGRIVF